MSLKKSDTFRSQAVQLALTSGLSRKGNCYDNAAVETFFKSLKAELVWRTTFENRDQAGKALFKYINKFYKPKRRHSYLGNISPMKFEMKAA